MSISRKWWIRLASGMVLSATAFGLVGNPAFCAEKYYLDGVLAYQQKNYHVARGIFERLHREKPQDVKITYYLAITHARLGEVSEARNLYQAVINTDPESSAAQLAREGMRYLPDPDRLDAPPRVSLESPASEAVDQRAVHELIGPSEQSPSAEEEMPQLKLTPVHLSSEEIRKSAAAGAADEPAYQARSAYDHPANHRIVSDNNTTESGQTQNPQTPAPAMNPQDMMAWQMMMMGMGNPNGVNPMMMMNPTMMNPMMGQMYGQNGDSQGGFQMDPQAYSTLMMNQMLQNFDVMGGHNNDR